MGSVKLGILISIKLELSCLKFRGQTHTPTRKSVTLNHIVGLGLGLRFLEKP